MTSWRKRLGLAGRALSAQPPAPEAWAAPAVRATLPDGPDRAEALTRRFGSDPDGAIAGLESLRDAYAPDPHVLHALALAYHRRQRTAEAVETARTAIALCFRRGCGLLAAELFDALDADAEALGIGRAELVALGGALGRTVHWPLAFRALASVVLRDPDDPDAVRELLRIVDWLTVQQSRPADAERIIGFLRVAGTSLVEPEPVHVEAEFDAVAWLGMD